MATTLTNGETYVFAKVNNTAIITSGTDDAHLATKNIRTNVGITGDADITGGIKVGDSPTGTSAIHISGSSTPAILIEENADSFVKLGVKTSGDHQAFLGWHNDKDLQLGTFTSKAATSVTPVMTLTHSSKRVGIGVDAPTEKLEVSGDMSCSADLHVGNDIHVRDQIKWTNQAPSADEDFMEISTAGDHYSAIAWTRDANNKCWAGWDGNDTGHPYYKIMTYNSHSSFGAWPFRSFKFHSTGDCEIPGHITKGTGTFRIPHPDPELNATHVLQHSFVESPTEGDNIYRWQVEVTDNSHSITLPDYYKFLNKNDMAWISPVDHFGIGHGKVNAEQTSLDIKTNENGLYNVLLIGTRKDKLAEENYLGEVIINEDVES
jgi:hypothetical protein